MSARAIALGLVLVATGAGAGDFSGASCVFDCNGDERVTIDELTTAIGMALGEIPQRAGSCQNFWPPFINFLVRAVDNALNGCPQPRVVDFSGFRRFDFLRSPSFGFCPVEGSVLAATIVLRDDGSYTFKSSIIERGDPATDRCVVGEFVTPLCYVTRVQPCRTLTTDEVARLQTAFAAVTV